jgi:hypothetical protein
VLVVFYGVFALILREAANAAASYQQDGEPMITVIRDSSIARNESMIVRVARAIALARCEASWQSYLDAARAALEAMREPTPEMLEGATAGLPDWGDLPEDWKKMIDHALSEMRPNDYQEAS